MAVVKERNTVLTIMYTVCQRVGILVIKKNRKNTNVYISYQLSSFNTGGKEKNRLDNIIRSHYCDDICSSALLTTV